MGQPSVLQVVLCLRFSPFGQRGAGRPGRLDYVWSLRIAFLFPEDERCNGDMAWVQGPCDERSGALMMVKSST